MLKTAGQDGWKNDFFNNFFGTIELKESHKAAVRSQTFGPHLNSSLGCMLNVHYGVVVQVSGHCTDVTQCVYIQSYPHIYIHVIGCRECPFEKKNAFVNQAVSGK